MTNQSIRANWRPEDSQPVPAAEALRAAGRAPNGNLPPTEPQLDYVEALRRRHRLPKELLDNHCVERFRHPLTDLDRRQVSALIEEMRGWEQPPAELLRARGQLDLPGMGGA